MGPTSCGYIHHSVKIKKKILDDFSNLSFISVFPRKLFCNDFFPLTKCFYLMFIVPCIIVIV